MLKLKAWISRWLAPPAQLLTGVAGFWLRRRWADATGFALILLLLASLYQIFWWAVWQWAVPADTIAQDVGWYMPANAGYLVAVLVVNLLATWRLHTGRPVFGAKLNARPWLTVVLGGLVLYISQPLLVRSIHSARVLLNQHTTTLDHALINDYAQDRFREYVRFGSPPDHITYVDRSVLQAGSGHIRGHIEYAGAPVKIYLQAELDNRFKTQFVHTDSANNFDIPVPPGKYTLHGIHTEWWAGKPSGNYFLAPLDSKLPFRGAVYHSGPATALNIAPAGVATVPPLIILPFIKITLPTGAGTRGGDMTLRWSTVPGATRYRVQVEQDVDVEYSATLLCRDAASPSLPLTSFITPAPRANTYRYNVDVKAYSNDSTLLNESRGEEVAGGGYIMPSFSLPAGSRLATTRLPAGEWSCPDSQNMTTSANPECLGGLRHTPPAPTAPQPARK